MAVHMQRTATVVDGDAAIERDVYVERSTTATPSVLLSLIAGAALVVFGIVALLRGDIAGSWKDPVVDVVGIHHTPLLGLIDIGAGVLLLAGLLGSAGGRIFTGVLLAIGGAVLWIEAGDLRPDLAAQWGYGAVLLAVGAVIAIAAFIEGDRRSVSRKVVDTGYVEVPVVAAPVAAAPPAAYPVETIER